MPSFPVNDYRGATTPRNRAMQGEIDRMRARGLSLPTNPRRAAQEAQKMAEDVKDGSAVRAMRRQQVNQSQITKARQNGMGRMASAGGGGDMTIAIDKQREPLQSMTNKGIPFDTSDPSELSKIRSWCRSYQATHHLLPLMIDIYSRFPIKGMEIDCFAADTKVITRDGTREIADLANESHEVLTRGGNFVEAKFASYGIKNLVKLTVKRNGIYKDIFTTPRHRWFVQGQNGSTREILTQDLKRGDCLVPVLERMDDWIVVNVEKTDRVEETYCTEVPGYECFVLEDNVLTGNCKDPQLKQFYEQLFFDELNYEQFLLDFGNEFFTVGEVNSLANFNEVLGVWDNEEILNPEDIIVQKSPFLKHPRYKLRVPEMIREIIDSGEPRIDYEIITQQYPEFLQMMHSVDIEEEGMDISNILMLRTVNKAAPWDVRGTPHMLRCFQTLIGEESLNAAQDAIADRLYSPLIMAKLGSPDLGDGAPWIPDADELANFTNDMQMALAADFRFMAYHFGIEVENVFGREQMPRLGDDYDRIERKLLQVWGIGESMISGGSSQAAYASTAVNREVCELLMEGFQKKIQQHFKERAEVVAEAQEHFDYKVSNGVRVPEYEEVLMVDEESGEEYVRKRPKLLLPEINFATMNLRDESTERAFMQELKSAGVPISDQAMMINVPIEFKDEIERVKEEKVQKIVADAEAQESAVKAIMSRNLPLSPELQLIRQQMQAAEQNYPTQQSSGNLPGAPVLPGQNKNQNGAQSPQNNGSKPSGGGGGGGQAPGGGGGAGGGSGSGGGSADNPLRSADPNSPEGQIEAQQEAAMLTEYQDMPTPPIHDLTTDNLENDSPPGTGVSKRPQTTLPRNQITQRPSISDNMRGQSPKSGKLSGGPSVVGMRNKLDDDDVFDAVRERKWARWVTGGDED